MALPNEDCVEAQACSSLFDIAQNILAIAYPAVIGSMIDVGCDLPEIVGYVSMGRQIQDPVGDYLVVSLQSVGPSSRSSDGAGNMQNPVYRATFQVKLLETGWPTPWGDNDEIIPPNPMLVSNASNHSYAHGEAMYRSLANALARKELVPGCGSCFQRIDAMMPLEPSGGTVGWMVNVTTGAFGA